MVTVITEKIEAALSKLHQQKTTDYPVPDNLAPLIDHTLLKPDARKEDIDRLCKEALEHEFATVCVNPVHVRRCVLALENSKVQVASVVGFPLGATTSDIKAFETKRVVDLGALEVDMVMNIGQLKDRLYEAVLEDVHRVVQTAGGHCVKVILETGLLNREEKIAACVICLEAGAAFVKTSTGMVSGGATVEDVRLMRQVVGEQIGVKAAGGIRDAETARAMVKAGATRLGASASLEIIGAS